MAFQTYSPPTVERSLKDPHLALLSYCSTPVEATDFSPARLLMGRELQARLPVVSQQREEEDILRCARSRDGRRKEKKQQFNKHHGARQLTQLKRGDLVRVKTGAASAWSEPATVLKKVSRRSYLVELQGADYRRNRRHSLFPSPVQSRREQPAHTTFELKTMPMSDSSATCQRHLPEPPGLCRAGRLSLP